ncbi:hypothetical protein BBO01nite_44410 [Brevibacillus borstelensis]|nr:hypothetical protein BBO01nite_44410 [Brevibacillus borstelensis]
MLPTTKYPATNASNHEVPSYEILSHEVPSHEVSSNEASSTKHPVTEYLARVPAQDPVFVPLRIYILSIYHNKEIDTFENGASVLA